MGTNFKDGQKPKNRITVSRGGEVPARKVDADTGEQDRSFAQPNPVAPPPKVEPKAHASEIEEAKALEENSQEGRKYSENDDD